MDVYQYRDSKKIITYQKNIDLIYARDMGSPVSYRDELVGYYLDEGFYVVSVPMTEVKEFSERYMWFIVSSLVFLNPESSVDDLVDFMYLYMVEFSTMNGYEPSRVYLRGVIDKCIDKLDEERCYQYRKFFFVKVLSKKDVKSAVMLYLNKRSKSEMMKKIDNVIQWLCIESNKFITANLIKEGLDEEVSLSTIRRYMELFKEEIDRHNRKVFGTDNFNVYQKTLSIHNIKRAIQVLNDANERLSRRNIADKAGVHFNTVQNLWDDEEIQQELDKFNKVA